MILSHLPTPKVAKSCKSSKALLALSLQLGQQGGDLPRARGAQGMSQGDGAALGVHLVTHPAMKVWSVWECEVKM